MPNECRLGLSNPDKVLFPQSQITKKMLVDYYRRIACVALPSWRERPLTMQRFPDGIDADGFFQKNVPDHFPAWIDTVELAKSNGRVNHLVANEAATLAYIADQGCITPHLGLARRDRPNHPDRMVFDLDPPDGDFGKVQKAAKWLRTLLGKLDLTGFVMTTGSRGVHVVVPLDRSADFDAVRGFAHELGRTLALRQPQDLTVEQRKAKRGDRVFIDYLRNAYGQTAVAPYAVRAIEGAPVATPLRWDEVGAADLSPRRYTIRNLFRRLARIADPWSDMGHWCGSIAAAKDRLAELQVAPGMDSASQAGR